MGLVVASLTGAIGALPRDSAAETQRDLELRQARQAAERERLAARIAELRQRIAAGERSRAGATSSLRQAERALAEAGQKLGDLDRRRRAVDERLGDLDRQRAGREREIVAREDNLARLARAAHAAPAPTRLQSILTGRDPDEAARTDEYVRLLAGAEAADAATLRGRVAVLDAERQRADEENRRLAAETEQQRDARQALVAEQEARRAALTRIGRELDSQRTTASALEADERRLARVIDQLQRELERQAAAERAKKRAADAAARRRAEPQAARKRDDRRDETPSTRIEAVPDDRSDGAFARSRGRLRLPVRGVLSARFGAPRGNGGATWKGVFIRADEGSEVRAVGAGKVVFADELRGFGNLLIVDHGDQYLSIYGNNRSLVRRSGETVGLGDVLALSGNSAGEEESGLYFELRFRGRPFDPLSWTGGR